jgi:GntR family transcriptional repressor for pyruvate dehydrogenase complex
MAPDRTRVPKVTRTRLYEQVAEQITSWITDTGLTVGDRLPPERELAQQLGVSRATLGQALVALEVIGVVTVRRNDGTVISRTAAGTIAQAIRAHADRLPEILETRDALETKIASLAAQRHTEEDLREIEAALAAMEAEIAAGGRGIDGDERFHAAVTAASHSALLARLMAEIATLIRETRIESLSQPDRPQASLAGHRAIAAAIAAGDPTAAARAMQDHIGLVSEVALIGGDA